MRRRLSTRRQSRTHRAAYQLQALRNRRTPQRAHDARVRASTKSSRRMLVRWAASSAISSSGGASAARSARRCASSCASASTRAAWNRVHTTRASASLSAAHALQLCVSRRAFQRAASKGASAAGPRAARSSASKHTHTHSQPGTAARCAASALQRVLLPAPGKPHTASKQRGARAPSFMRGLTTLRSCRRNDALLLQSIAARGERARCPGVPAKCAGVRTCARPSAPCLLRRLVRSYRQLQ